MTVGLPLDAKSGVKMLTATCSNQARVHPASPKS
jgi:hypothetical protein